jgi:serine/threonine protein kinase
VVNEFELFQLALDIDDPSARRLYLMSACEQNQEMLGRVEALLASHDGQSQFLNTPVVEQIGDTTNADPDATGLLANGSAHAAHQDAADDEIPLGYLEPSTKADSLGRLAHYEVLEVVGRGAFGTVLRAFDEKLQRVVAIKVMALELAATSPARKRFMREAQASAAIRHEYVVSVFAVEEKPLPYLVMEYIPGRTLQQRLDERGPLDLPTVLRLGRQIAEGLAAAHAQELIHRDIKPGNILLETNVQDRVKISDFGLARAADDASLTQSGTIAGTPMYMAPEQALGHKLDCRADLFSFGSVLYQMVSGRPPFRASTALAVLKRVVDETPRPIREIIPETPQWLCDIITKLHAKNPDERYQSAREIADVLANCESQLKAQAELRDFSLIPQTKSRPAVWWKGVAAAALLLALLAFGLIRFNRPAATHSAAANTTPNLNPEPETPTQPTAQDIPESDGWEQLFNGKDLTGWKLLPGSWGDWKVSEGILQGSIRQSHLFSLRDDYANFHLRAEVKVNLGGDSGIMFRTPFKLTQGMPGNYGIPDCYEVELQESRPVPRRTGSILRTTGDARPVVVGLVSDDSLAQPDEWFTVEIIAVDNQFITRINGLEVANSIDLLSKHATGHVALQVWHPNTLVQFRKIEIKELPLSKSPGDEQLKRRFASDEWIDVIPLIDPQSDKWDVPKVTGKNAWRIEEGELVVDGDRFPSKLILPLDIDGPALECEIDFTRRAGDIGFVLNLPAALGEVNLLIDYPQGLTGVRLGSRTAGVQLNTDTQIATARRTMLRVEVRRQQDADHVFVDLDGEKIGEWTGDRNAIATIEKQGYPTDRRMSLWIVPGEFVFHRIRVRMLDGGSAATLRPVLTTPSASAAAQDPAQPQE